jgi:hypothetical protein
VPCDAGSPSCTDSNGEPCTFGDPDCWAFQAPDDEQCSGMNGVMAVEWAGDCTWTFRGVPAGTGALEVRASLVLDGFTWTLTLRGPDGQVAVFRNVGSWDCGAFVTMPFVLGESTCTMGSEATMNLSVIT